MKMSIHNIRDKYYLITLIMVFALANSGVFAAKTSSYVEGVKVGLNLFEIATGEDLFSFFGNNEQETTRRVLGEINSKLDMIASNQAAFTDSIIKEISKTYNFEIESIGHAAGRYMRIDYKNAKDNLTNSSLDLSEMVELRADDLADGITHFEIMNSDGKTLNEYHATTVSSHIYLTSLHLAILKERVLIYLSDNYRIGSESESRKSNLYEYLKNTMAYCNSHITGLQKQKKLLETFVVWKKNNVTILEDTKQGVVHHGGHDLREYTYYRFILVDSFANTIDTSEWVIDSTDSDLDSVRSAEYEKRNKRRKQYQNEYKNFVDEEIQPTLNTYASFLNEIKEIRRPTSSNLTIRLNDTVKVFSSGEFKYFSEILSDTLVSIKISNIQGNGLLFDNMSIQEPLEIEMKDIRKLTLDPDLMIAGKKMTFDFTVSNGSYSSNEYRVTVLNPLRIVYNTELSPGTTVAMPLYSNVNAVIDWGDGYVETVNSDSTYIHTYENEGTYVVSLTGNVKQFGDTAESYREYTDKILKVKSFGNLSLVSLQGAFYGAVNLDSVPASLPSQVKELDYTFKDTEQNISGVEKWDVSNVQQMSYMFSGNKNFNRNLSMWNTSKAEDLSGMFSGSVSFEGDISSWDVGEVESMADMFLGVELPVDMYTSILTKWAAIRVKRNVLFGAGNSKYYLHAEQYKEKLSNRQLNWVIEDGGALVDPMILLINTNYTEGTTVSLPLFDTVYVDVDWGDGTIERITAAGIHTHTYEKEGEYTISINGYLTQFGSHFTKGISPESYIAVESWGNIGLQSLKGAFQNATNLKSVPEVLPSSITSLEHTFKGTKTSIDGLESWDVSRIHNMDSLFAGNISFTGDLSKWNTNSVVSMQGVFTGASLFNSDLSDWDVSNVSTFSGMFSGASSFQSDLSGWNVSNATNFSGMFSGASSFESDLSDWNVSNATNFSDMFSGASSFESDLSGWVVDNSKDFRTMFSGAISFDSDISQWNVKRNAQLDGMFEDVTLSVKNYDAILIGWNEKAQRSNDIVFSGGNSKYSPAAAVARENLINKKKWTITDGGPADLTQIDNIENLAVEEDFAMLEVLDLNSVITDYQGNTVTYTVSSMNNIIVPTIDLSMLKIESKDNIFGIDTVVVTATTTSAVVMDSFAVTVAPVNDVPTLSRIDNSQIVSNESVELFIDMTDAYDVEGEELTLLIGRTDNCSVDGNRVYPNDDFSGILEVPVTVTDGTDTSEIAVWEINVDFATALISIATASDVTDLQFYPNPATAREDSIKLFIPTHVTGLITIEIFDYLGTSLHKADIDARGGELYSWDLTNRNGVMVGTGSYIAAITLIEPNGKQQYLRRVIGVKR